jgi:pimeloyl-ACP methyl ester carboxylesterase
MESPFSTNLKLVSEAFCGTAAERGSIDVPVRHDDPGPAVITLRFIRLPRRGAGTGAPLVFLTGGPGLSGIQSGSGRLFPLFDALRVHGDVILLDQRACVVDERVLREGGPHFPIDRVVSREEYLERIARTVRRDVANLAAGGIPVAALDSAQSADDVALLVRALYGPGARTALLGWSYGSHLAMTIMKRHEAMVARVVLAAPEGPDHTLKLPSRVHAHLERLSRRAGRDLVAMLARALDRLDREPARVPMPADESGTAQMMLGRFDLAWTMSELVADTRALRRLPAWLERMERGDFQVLGSEALLRGAWEALREELPHSAVRYCFDCASGATPERHARIEREARETLLGNTIDFPLPEICHAIEGCGSKSGDAIRSPVESGVPALFIHGTVDCRTPAENIDELVPGIQDHERLEVEDAGHGDLLLAGEAQRAIARFLRGERLERARVRADAPLTFETG